MDEDISTMLNDLEIRQNKLNDWELEFYEDMCDEFYLHGDLTPSQTNKLAEIWNKYTDSYPAS